MLPTYGRGLTKLNDFLNSVVTTCDKGKTYVTLLVKRTDADTLRAIESILAGWEYTVLYEDLDKPHLAKYFNQIYDETPYKEPGTLVSMLGDDMVFDLVGWQDTVLQWANLFNGLGIFYGADGIRDDKLATYFFTSRAFVDAQKPYPFMCEYFPCDDIDIVWHMVAMKLNKLYYIPGMHLYHNHATLRGNMDEVWQRLRWGAGGDKREGEREIAGYYGGNKEYEENCCAKIRETLNEYRLPVVMTTHDRVDLLHDTVASYMASSDMPDKIYVFDDKSEDLDGVRRAVGRIPGVEFFEGDERRYAQQKTPLALRQVFENSDHEAVIVLDSDCLMYRHWYQRAMAMYATMKEKGIGVTSLFNAGGIPGTEFGVPGMLKKCSVGGLAMIVTREFWKEHVTKFENGRYTDWDNKSCFDAVKAGKTVACSAPSFVQHTGVYEGTHVGTDPSAYAHDYLGDCKIYEKYCRGEGDGVLFSLMGRYGDVILGSMVANMIIDKGFELTWLTVPLYRDLIDMLCPRARKFVTGDSPECAWSHTSTKRMTELYPGFRYYINAQPGAPENHDNLIGSGVSMAKFVKQLCERILEVSLPDDFRPYMRGDFRPLPVLKPDWPQDKPLCIICPEVVSIPTAINGTLLEELIRTYSEKYTVRVLVRKRPQGLSTRAIRERYICNLTFMQCFSLLRSHTALYIGNDSGLAWVALYCKCKKIIYHNSKRVRETNMLYGRIDPTVEDLIL
jgi:hypothetical protein